MSNPRNYTRLNIGARGARILNTGLALVHKGELVLPAAGTEAQAETVLADGSAAIIYYFPVEVEVRYAADPPDPEQAAEKTLWRTIHSFQNR
jgi:hypothetical protein